MGVSRIEISAEDNEVVPTVIINQFGHLVHLALSATSIGLLTISKTNRLLNTSNLHVWASMFPHILS